MLQALSGSRIAVPDPQNDEIAAWAYQLLQPHQRELIDSLARGVAARWNDEDDMTPLYDRDGWIWLDGEWLPWAKPRRTCSPTPCTTVWAASRGVRAYAGAHGTHLFRVAEHTRRLLDSAHALGHSRGLR